MPARVTIDSLVILDELESRMRRTAARVAALADEEAGDAAYLSRLREAARALCPFVPELALTLEGLPDAPADPPDAGGGHPVDEEAEEDLSGVDSVTLLTKARAFASAEDEEKRARARSIWQLISEERLRPTGAPAGAGLPGQQTGATDPVATAQWIGLSADLWAADGHVRYLDAVEKAYYNGVLFAQTDDGAGVVGRTLDGDPGEADDVNATPAVALALAEAGRHVLMVCPDSSGAEGGLVSGVAANASAVLTVGGEERLRVLVQTQIPVRGWTSWVFEPLKATADSAPASAVTTRRTARKRRGAVRSAPVTSEPSTPLADAGGGQDAGAATFKFRVRVPKWAASSRTKPDDDSRRRSGPGVKIDGRPVNVERTDGFYRFEVPTDRATKIEVILDIGPWTLERKGAVSWGGEVAVGYGPLLLTALLRVNPGEDPSTPLRITSKAEDLKLAGDIRRRLPLVEAKALGGGTGRVLLAPISEVGGFAGGPGAEAPLRCQRFRTWHRS